MQFTIALYAFGLALLIMLVGFRYLWNRQQIRERLSFFTEAGMAGDAAQLSGLRGIIRQFSGYFEAVSWAIRKEELLMQARIPFKGSEFMVVSLGVALIAMLLLAVLFGKGFWPGVVLGGIVAFNIPTIVVKLKIKKRQELLNEQLPAALTTMANSLRSGYSYMQALDLVSKEMPHPLGEEFGLVVQEMNLGITTEEALTNLVKRVNTDDLDLTVTAFLIQRQVGGNLAELLDNITETIRERVKMKEKINTLTAQGKLSGLILCLLPIFLAGVIYIVNSEYIVSFFNDPRGKVAIGVGIVSQSCGVYWMRKIINIDV